MQVLLWLAWALVALNTIFVLVMATTSSSSVQNRARRGLGLVFTLTGVAVLLAGSVLLLVSGRDEWSALVFVAVGFLLLPVFIAVAPLLEHFLSRIEERRKASRRDTFENPQLAELADAIASNDTRRIMNVLREHPALDGRDSAGKTVLAYAIEQVLQGKSGISPVRALLDAGADPNEQELTSDNQLLVRVFEDTSVLSNQLFKLLLDRQADPDTRDRFGTPILHHAKGQLMKLKILADSAADFNLTSDYHYQRGWTPVMALAMDEAYDEALYLVQRGASVHHVAPDGWTLSSVLERREQIAYKSGLRLPDSYRSLVSAVTVHAQRR